MVIEFRKKTYKSLQNYQEFWIMEEKDDYLDHEFRRQCAELIPDTSEIDPREAANAYLHVKTHIANS